jgi:tetratricopeptide (TPR) repeat protein
MSLSAFSAYSLFGPAATLYDLAERSPFLERAAGEQDENRAALALAAYALGRLIHRCIAGSSEPAAVELGQELESLQAHLRELPQDDPEAAHLSHILAALHPDLGVSPGLGRELLRYAAFLEQQGRLEEALEAAALAARGYGPEIAPGDLAECALTAGRLNRLLARWGPALTCYEAAELTGHAERDAVAALRGRLGRGAVARGRGNLPAARAIAEAVREEARSLNLPQVQTIACGDLAAACFELGQPVEALEADYEAFRVAQDPADQMRTLGNVGTDLVQLGWHDAARTAFTIVLRSDTKATVRLNALIELMALEAGAGDMAAFDLHYHAAESCRDQMPPSMAVDFLFKTASGRKRFGQPAAARATLTEAQTIAEAHDLHAWAFRIDRALRDLDAVEAAPLPEPPATPRRESPVVREVAAGLEEYAAASR